jgi:hypothetical protein
MTVARFDEIALLFSFWSSIVFIVGYSVISPWWRERISRAVVALDACITLTLLPSAVKYMFGVSPRSHFLLWYTGFALLLVGATALWRLAVVWAVQRGATPRRPAVVPEEEEVSQ